MADKVLGGTPKGGECSLCKTCHLAMYRVGLNLQEVVRCGWDSKLISFPIVQCSQYQDKRLPTLQRMMEIAWEVTSRPRGAVGFGEAMLEIKITPPQQGYPVQPTTNMMAEPTGREKESHESK